MIRPFAPRDLADVLEVWEQASRVAHSFLDSEFLERERTEIAERHLPAAETWVWDEDGRAVGFIALIGDEVGGLFVHPAHQRRGIGRALMDHALASRRPLELGVFEANAIGRAFYETYGFEVVGKAVHGPSGQPELRMRVARESG